MESMNSKGGKRDKGNIVLQFQREDSLKFEHILWQWATTSFCLSFDGTVVNAKCI